MGKLVRFPRKRGYRTRVQSKSDYEYAIERLTEMGYAIEARGWMLRGLVQEDRISIIYAGDRHDIPKTPSIEYILKYKPSPIIIKNMRDGNQVMLGFAGVA